MIDVTAMEFSEKFVEIQRINALSRAELRIDPQVRRKKSEAASFSSGRMF